MKLYKETGTNPLSCCLPLLVQSPIFFALFHVLSLHRAGQAGRCHHQPAHGRARPTAPRSSAPRSTTTFRSAPPGDVTTKVVAAIMIVLMTATTFLTQRQLMVKNLPIGASSPLMQQQKILLYVFPLMFAVVRHRLPDRRAHLLADHQPVDDGPAVLRDPPQPDPGQRGGRRAAEAPRGEGGRQGGRARRRPPAPRSSRRHPNRRGSAQQPKRAPRSQRPRGAPAPRPTVRAPETSRPTPAATASRRSRTAPHQTLETHERGDPT